MGRKIHLLHLVAIGGAHPIRENPDRAEEINENMSLYAPDRIPNVSPRETGGRDRFQQSRRPEVAGVDCPGM